MGSISNAPGIAVHEATWGKLLNDEQFRNELQRLVRKNARGLSKKQTAECDASRLQLEQGEKHPATKAKSFSPKEVKTHERERRELKLKIINGGMVLHARANPSEEARLAWELPRNILAIQ